MACHTKKIPGLYFLSYRPLPHTLPHKIAGKREESKEEQEKIIFLTL
jgi:hypothetical protein